MINQHFMFLTPPWLLWSTVGVWHVFWNALQTSKSVGHYSPSSLVTRSHMSSVDLIHKKLDSFHLSFRQHQRPKLTPFTPPSSDPKLDFNNWGEVPFKVLNGAFLSPHNTALSRFSNAKVPLLELHSIISDFFCRRFSATKTSWHWSPWDRRMLGNTFAAPWSRVSEQGRRRFLSLSMVSCVIDTSFTQTGSDEHLQS